MAERRNGPDSNPKMPRTAGGGLVAMVSVLFLLSGATSLAYQVAWTRMLSLFFGSDVYAAAITLGIFMGGLSLGSWVAGRWGDQLRRPLLVYGVCEIAIGGCAILFPILLSAFEPVYQGVYRSHFDANPGAYHGLRLSIATAVLAVPTLLMGATLPLIVRQFAVAPEILGRRVGEFYALNTLGALLGTLVAGFVLLPTLGVGNTVLVSLAVNLAIGILAMIIGWRDAREPSLAKRNRDETSASTRLDPDRRRVLVVMGLSGLAAMALEVVWMRVLVQSFSATVYAFSIMLACFLFGIFYGSRRVSVIIDQHRDPKGLLVTLELWLGAAAALLGVLAYIVPGLFGLLVWGFTGLTGGEFGAASVLAQFLVSIVLILGPTIMLGASFPVAIKIYTDDLSLRARSTGAVYAANTAGGVLGSLGAGFVLLPALGTRISLMLISATFLAAGIVLALNGSWRSIRSILEPKLAWPAGVAIASAIVAALLPPQTVINFNLQKSTNPKILFHGEGVTHTVDIIENDRGNIIMMINGNIEADTGYLQRRHFILKAHVPLLLHPDPKDIAVVGLGLGVTLAATERHPTVETIRLIELSPDMVEAHEHIRETTGHILDSPKVRLRIDDGRNFMAMTDEKFDMITADPVHPRITGVGYLYTREYYELLKSRLRPGGVVAQWMPMYRISRQSFDVAFRTFVEVFPNATFWYVRGHGLFVATLDEGAIDYESVAERFADPAISADLASIDIETPEELLGHLLMDSDQIQEYLGVSESQTVNTDDNAYLEYRTPFEFIQRTENIVDALLPHSGWDVEAQLHNATPGVTAEVERQYQYRLQRIRPELSEPID